MRRPEDRRRPFRPPSHDEEVPPPPKFGGRARDELQRIQLDHVDPKQYVGLVFEAEPARARFVCLPCDEPLLPDHGGWRCTSCGYSLQGKDATVLVREGHQLLRVLAPGADERSEPSMPVGVPSDLAPVLEVPSIRPQGWRKLFAWISSVFSDRR